GERINPEEPKRMIDPIEMKYLPDIIDSDAPPVEIAAAQLVPAIDRHAPVLTPFFCKRIYPENFFRRRAAAPIQVEQRPVGPYIRAESPHAEWDVAHQINLLLGAVSFEPFPLAEGQPLDVHEKKLLAHQFVASFLRQRDK